MEVHRWISEVQCNAFRGKATVCIDGELGQKDMQVWTRKAIEGM